MNKQTPQVSECLKPESPASIFSPRTKAFLGRSQSKQTDLEFSDCFTLSISSYKKQDYTNEIKQNLQTMKNEMKDLNSRNAIVEETIDKITKIVQNVADRLLKIKENSQNQQQTQNMIQNNNITLETKNNENNDKIKEIKKEEKMELENGLLVGEDQKSVIFEDFPVFEEK